MVNERKTEAIVRAHFNNFFDDITVEEQKSDNPRIKKLLKSASKTGDGPGYPEFIISYKQNPDFLIVVECKANITKHESRNHDRPSEYAVDGALLYASYLSRGFDILAIGVSGETKNQIKISHFLYLKNANNYKPVFGKSLLSPEDYLHGYIKDPGKYKQDYATLLDFMKRLNKDLGSKKIEEDKRALLISAVLIALEDEAFKQSYTSQRSPKNLADSLVTTVCNQLESENLERDELDTIKNRFNIIKTDMSLARKQNILKDIIDDIDENINTFIKTHQYIDVLGELYTEFLSYANSDKGLGIVLTPRHITDFFADLAQTNENSIVYDNCAGTGGFLISAMKRMVECAEGDNKKIKQIKQEQLIGTEYQEKMFSLAISNMYIHQDGKTGVIYGDCFDEKVIEKVKSKKPNVGFLNPPFKQDKRNDREELEYVLNNLECLIQGGICIAVVPMQSALAQDGKILSLKAQLLEKHTLEAVFSMPNELFENSDTSAVCCVMVFTAHKPHPPNQKTYFGYYKDDGFVKLRNKGRIDAYGKWDEIQEKWITNYRNKIDEAGISVNKKVTSDMEWCAEAYLTTDYSSLSEEIFLKELKQYIAFKILN